MRGPSSTPTVFDPGRPSCGALWWAQVIGQQISLVAAGAIRGRLASLCGGLLPELLALDEGTLPGDGLSRAKTAYLYDLPVARAAAATRKAHRRTCNRGSSGTTSDSGGSGGGDTGGSVGCDDDPQATRRPRYPGGRREPAVDRVE